VSVDLHTHTRASDGALTPRELVRKAAGHGVRVLAITDHDSTEGLAEAGEEAARHPGLTLVPGLEINCNVEGAEIHVLGYLVDHAAPWFREFLAAQRAARTARVYALTARLAELGIAIESRVQWERGGSSIYFRDPDGRSVELATPGLWPCY